MMQVLKNDVGTHVCSLKVHLLPCVGRQVQGGGQSTRSELCIWFRCAAQLMANLGARGCCLKADASPNQWRVVTGHPSAQSSYSSLSSLFLILRRTSQGQIHAVRVCVCQQGGRARGPGVPAQGSTPRPTDGACSQSLSELGTPSTGR